MLNRGITCGTVYETTHTEFTLLSVRSNGVQFTGLYGSGDLVVMRLPWLRISMLLLIITDITVQLWI